MSAFFTMILSAFAEKFSDPHTILGNVLSLIGAIAMVSVGFLKHKKHILIVQSGQCAFMGTGNLLLGGVTGFITNIVSIIRNLFCLKWKYTLPWKIAFLVVQVGLAIAFNKNGLIGWIPILSVGIFTFFLDTENELLLKGVIIGTQCLWLVYDAYLWNVVTVIFDILTLISNIIGVTLILNERKAQKEV